MIEERIRIAAEAMADCPLVNRDHGHEPDDYPMPMGYAHAIHVAALIEMLHQRIEQLESRPQQ